LESARPATARGPRFWLACALAALGCASGPHHETTVLAKMPERVVILPLNVATPMPAELKSESSAAWSALEVYLRAHGAALKTVAYPAARGLWLASIRDARADPKKKDPGFDDAARLFVGKLEQQSDFDALIIPSLYVQRATLSGTKATWDGTERTLEIEAPRGDGPVQSDAPIEGAVPAVSLHVLVFDRNGSKLHEGRAGLALLVRAKISHPSAPNEAPEFSFAPLRDPFADRASLMQGTATALAPQIPLLPARQLTELSTQIRVEPTAPDPALP
jgi:hypothetical protein